MRGLKLLDDKKRKLIEKSHLLQMRGLKQAVFGVFAIVFASHLLQMRGLKHFSLDREHHRHEVASFTDAWIETCFYPWNNFILRVASFTDAWIETRDGLLKISSFRVASFTDAWIETTVATRTAAILKSHLLQMRGLKRLTDAQKTQVDRRIFYRCVD